MDTVHTEILRGYQIEIFQDPDPLNPREEFDQVGTMVCHHGRYKLGDKHNYSSPEAAIRDVYDDFGPDYENDPEQWTLDHLNECKIIWLPLYLYDHSGITMSTGAFSSCPWDSGIVGFIYVPLERAHIEWPLGDNESDEDWHKRVAEYLRDGVREYDDYLTGNVYGFRVSKPLGDDEWDEIDSCWGFSGDYDGEFGCLSEARNNVPDEPADETDTIVMVFLPDGGVEFTRSPKLYDFFKGRGEMERISEIRKYGSNYYIDWLKGPYKGPHTEEVLSILDVSHPGNSTLHWAGHKSILLFETYEAAVHHEVRILNIMRRKGVKFSETP